MFARGHTETAGGAHADESAIPRSHRNRSAGRRRVGPRSQKRQSMYGSQPLVQLLRGLSQDLSSRRAPKAWPECARESRSSPLWKTP